MSRAPTGAVDIRDVGPRDGLQAEAPVDIEARVRLVEGLVAAGVRHIEACSFVSPNAVPAMAGAAEVMAAVPRSEGVRYAALVPNLRGADMALAAGVDELTVTISASETYNRRNVKMSTAESESVLAEICQAAASGDVPVDAVVSCAFGSPYEGDIGEDEVGALCRRLRAGGVSAITLADTTGMATPPRVRSLLDAVGTDVGVHLHETRGTGLLNAWVAFEAGVRRFDASVGGLGGSPFAAGAAGNVATEELVAVLHDAGVDTGIDLDALVEVAGLVADIVGHPVPSRVAMAGPRSRLAGTG